MSKKLQVAIQTLHDRLENSEAVDACTQATLKQLTADIDRAVHEAQGQESAIPEDLNKQIDQAFLMLANKHPKVTEVLVQVVRILNEIGL